MVSFGCGVVNPVRVDERINTGGPPVGVRSRGNRDVGGSFAAVHGLANTSTGPGGGTVLSGARTKEGGEIDADAASKYPCPAVLNDVLPRSLLLRTLAIVCQEHTYQFNSLMLLGEVLLIL